MSKLSASSSFKNDSPAESHLICIIVEQQIQSPVIHRFYVWVVWGKHMGSKSKQGSNDALYRHQCPERRVHSPSTVSPADTRYAVPAASRVGRSMHLNRPDHEFDKHRVVWKSCEHKLHLGIVRRRVHVSVRTYGPGMVSRFPP
jgi:hypothetical protein